MRATAPSTLRPRVWTDVIMLVFLLPYACVTALHWIMPAPPPPPEKVESVGVGSHIDEYMAVHGEPFAVAKTVYTQPRPGFKSMKHHEMVILEYLLWRSEGKDAVDAKTQSLHVLYTADSNIRRVLRETFENERHHKYPRFSPMTPFGNKGVTVIEVDKEGLILSESYSMMSFFRVLPAKDNSDI